MIYTTENIAELKVDLLEGEDHGMLKTEDVTRNEHLEPLKEPETGGGTQIGRKRFHQGISHQVLYQTAKRLLIHSPRLKERRGLKIKLMIQNTYQTHQYNLSLQRTEDCQKG